MPLKSWSLPLGGLLWSMIFISQTGMDVAGTLVVALSFFFLVSSDSIQREFITKLKTGFLPKLFSVWFGIVLIGLILSSPPRHDAFLRLFEFRWMLELGLWVLLLRQFSILKTSWAWILTAPLLSALYGLWVLGTGINLPPFPVQDLANRLGGFYGNPMPYAHSVGPVFVALMAGGGLNLLRSKAISWSWWIVTTILGVSVLLTLTRGVWLACFVSLLMIPLLLRAPRAKTIAIVILILSGFAVGGIPSLRERALQAFDPNRSYDSERMVLWSTNLKIFRDHPIVGAGFGENRRLLETYYREAGLPENQFQSHAHNQYIQLLAGTGFLGLTCYLVFMVYVMRLAWILMRDDRLGNLMNSWGAGLFMGQVAFHLGSITESNFNIAKNRALLLFLIAVTLALHSQVRQSERKTLK